eukprot:TRINITY_DN12659_c0_g3_i1.p1 TRINITY_DN12659_c0_g3~~TRINITY_DN12659_c0_g3_i1.p1  ORF type:complete len:966 (-),score=133.00 TRINITY_DN12659_c0_g3_i1:282-3179(-)
MRYGGGLWLSLALLCAARAQARAVTIGGRGSDGSADVASIGANMQAIQKTAVSVVGTDAVASAQDSWAPELRCDPVVDTIDWPKLLVACSGWAVNRSYSSMGQTILKLSDYFEGIIGTSWRIQSYPCLGGLFAARLVGLEMFLAHDVFFGLTSDMTLRRGYWLFNNQSWVKHTRSVFARPVFEALTAYNRRAWESCPHFAGWPNGSVYDPRGLFPCVSNGKQQVIHLTLPSREAKWCALKEPAPLAVEKLWYAARASLSASRPLPELVETAAEYLRAGSYCDEATAVAHLGLTWAGAVSRTDGLRRAQDAMREHEFAHTIFTRWPVWEMWTQFTDPIVQADGPLSASSCVNFEPCEKTDEYYRQRRTPHADMPGECSRYPLIETAYRDGYLYANFSDGADVADFQIDVYDTTDVKQRMKPDEAQNIGLFGARKMRRALVAASELPKYLGFEGVRLYSAFHKYDNPEVHMEPQRDEAFANNWKRPGRRRGPSVYVLILDSVTRASFEAFCPRTVRYLRGKNAQRDWRSFEFRRFHAMYGGTAGNMFPFLTGQHYDPMLDSARRASWNCDSIRDGIPNERLLWNVLKSAGYVTAFGGSGCNGITGTRYCDEWLNHFHHVPPSLQVDFNCASQHEWAEAYKEPRRGCLGTKRPHEHLLGYFQRFFEVYKDSPAFGYLHLEMAHDNPKSLQLLDRSLEAHLRALAALPPESRPVVLLAGDHGPSGDCDWVSPLVSLMVPQSLIAAGEIRKKQLFFLRRNRASIVSWFDLHATLIHIATGANPRSVTGSRKSWALPSQATRSLLGLVPLNRTCENAGVPKSFCGCAQQWVQWCPVNPRGLEKTIALMIDGLNQQVAKFLSRDPTYPPGHCPPLVLRSIVLCETLVEDVRRYTTGDGNDEEVLLRLQFDTQNDFIYEVHASTAMRYSGQRVLALAKDIFNIRPISLYAKYESCAPIGVDPAMCHCVPNAAG